MTMKWDIQLSACSASVTLITRPWRQTRCESLQQSSPWWRARWTAEALREAPPTAPWLRVSNALWTGIGRYMQTCPLFSCLHMNSLSALKYWVKADPIRSQYWESWYGVGGGAHHPWTLYPSGFPTHPPSPASSCHPCHPCLTITTAVTCQPLCSPSAQHLCAGFAAGLSVSIGVMPGGSLVFPSTSAFWPRGSTMAPSSLLSAGLPHLSGSALVCRRPSAASGLHSSDCTSSLQLCQASPSLQLHLAPQSLRLHCVLPDPCLRLGRRRHLPCLGPPDPRCRPGSSALRLHLGLLHHLLRRHRSAPWSRQPFLHHGSFLRRLHCGPPSWLWPGSRLAPPAPSPSCLCPGSSLRLIRPGSYCFIPGSFLQLHHPGLCISSSSWSSGHLLNLLQSPFSIPRPLLCPPPKSPSVTPFFSAARGHAFWEVGDLSHPRTVFFPHVLCVTYFSIMFDCVIMFRFV